MSADEIMETDEDTRRGNLLDDMPPINCEGNVEGGMGASCNDSGDMTFCMGNYITDFMKVSLSSTFNNQLILLVTRKRLHRSISSN